MAKIVEVGRHELKWQPTFYGWHAHMNGKHLTVRRYRTSKGFTYVARVDGSAASSPAKAHSTAAAARHEAEAMAITPAQAGQGDPVL